MDRLHYAVLCILDLFLPERCQVCDAGPESAVSFLSPGRRVPGLRPWDRPHLCQNCRRRWRVQSTVCNLVGSGGEELPVAAGATTDPDLVALVTAMKYHGVRGAVWPLAELAHHGLRRALTVYGGVDGLVAVPLHASRQRTRGFNQAELLARLLAEQAGLPFWGRVVRRCRHTRQQARLPSTVEVRCKNVRHAFVANRPPGKSNRCVGLVDDLVTSGATVLAVTSALSTAGWRVRWAVAAGLASAAGTLSPLSHGETDLDRQYGRS